MKIEIRLRGEDSVTEGTVGEAPVTAHVVMEGILVGIALQADLTYELFGPAAAAAVAAPVPH